MSELLPCPFCGSELRKITSLDGVQPRYHYIHTHYVNCLMFDKVIYKNQIEAWNSRMTPPSAEISHCGKLFIHEQLKEMRAMLESMLRENQHMMDALALPGQPVKPAFKTALKFWDEFNGNTAIVESETEADREKLIVSIEQAKARIWARKL